MLTGRYFLTSEPSFVKVCCKGLFSAIGEASFCFIAGAIGSSKTCAEASQKFAPRRLNWTALTSVEGNALPTSLRNRR